MVSFFASLSTRRISPSASAWAKAEAASASDTAAKSTCSCFIIRTYFATILMLPTIPASKCPATRQP